MFEEEKRIDFDYSHGFEAQGDFHRPHDVALFLSTYLVGQVSQDELQNETRVDEPWTGSYPLDVGGAGLVMSNWTRSHQRCILAYHLAHYGSYKVQSCMIGENDYSCLKELKEDLEFDQWHFDSDSSGCGVKDYIKKVDLYLNHMIAWFEKVYGGKHPEWAKELTWKKLKT